MIELFSPNFKKPNVKIIKSKIETKNNNSENEKSICWQMLFFIRSKTEQPRERNYFDANDILL